ncbi:helix-turn-helix domain-containing protein [Streptomyces montanus]|uniref:helix-turn-helix domain-containing protein n=1 Tax=Streptomyces montanus TaxID=2580423 RepID=UPI001486CE11|nr:helix-turn-helix transcriptional regulator [Streptomyces montanus]
MLSTAQPALLPSRDQTGHRIPPRANSPALSASTVLYGPFASLVPRYSSAAIPPIAHSAPHRILLRCMAGAARGLTDEQIATALGLDLLQVREAMELLEDLVGVSGRTARPANVAYGYRTELLAGLAAEPARPLGAWLTPRRLAVLLLVAQGRTDEQIADTMGCTRKTASNTVHYVIRRFGAYDRAHTVALACQQRLLGQPLMPLPQHHPVRPFSPQEAELVRALAAGQTKQQIRTHRGLSARAATRLLSDAAEAAGVRAQRGFAALIDSAHRGGLLTAEQDPLAHGPCLPERRHQVLIGIAHGFTDAEIARRLHVAYDTVKTATRHLYDTLSAATRAQVVARGWEFHLLGTPQDTATSGLPGPGTLSVSAG